MAADLVVGVEGPEGPGGIAADGLDLHHLGPEVPEQHRGVGPGQHLGEVEHPHAVQRPTPALAAATAPVTGRARGAVVVVVGHRPPNIVIIWMIPSGGRGRPGGTRGATPTREGIVTGEAMSYVALSGSLGCGFREESLERSLDRDIAFIGCDSGSTDGGPYYLGSGRWIWADSAYERDLRLGLDAAARAGVPLIVGSCGGGGGDDAVTGYLAMVDRIVREQGRTAKVACVYTEVDREVLVAKLRQGRLPTLPGAPPIDEATLRAEGHIVAMAGAEQVQWALATGADVVLMGRVADAAIYAAMPLAAGHDPALVWNAAKIMECGAAAAENRSGQDSLLCTVDPEGFELEPLDPALRCTPASVATHTLYEVSDPFRLLMPSGELDAREARYEAIDDRRVRVSGGRWTPAEQYTVKLEGSAPVGHASSFWGSISDPLLAAPAPRVDQGGRGPAPGSPGRGGRRRLRAHRARPRRRRHHRPPPAGRALRGGARRRRRRRHPGGGVGHGPGGLPRGAPLAHRRLERWLGHQLRPPLQRPGRRPGAGLPVHAQPRGRARRRRAHRHLPPRDPPGRWAMIPRDVADARAWTDVVERVPNLTRHFRLIRSKDAGPFVLTVDLFCHDDDAFRRVLAAGVLDPELWAELYGVPVDAVEVHVVDAVHAVKVSFPRPIPSGDPRDRDITGGQQYSLAVEALARSPLGDP